MTALPSHARAVVIGGGIVGCSVAYHLTRLGWRDVVVVERAKLTSGSTWHAAGLVGQLRTSANITQLLKHSVELYDRLEAETGLATGWKRNGGLRLACNADRMIEIRRQATTARSFGLDMHVLSPAEAQALWPAMDSSDLVGAAYLPTDGQANPSDIAQSLARGARTEGARFVEDTRVTAVLVENGRACGVATDRGTIHCEAVVNCAGQWAGAVGALAGVCVPLVSIQHHYAITGPVPGVTRDLPTLRDPDRLIYFKEEVGGLSFGGYEPNPQLWRDGTPAEDFAFQLLDADLDHFEPTMREALARVPGLADVGLKQVVNGPESFTPDGNFILGEAPERPGFFVGAGFNAFGIASAGGAGKALAEWVVAGEPPMDLWPVDIRRFGAPHRDRAFVVARTLEAYARHYTMAWPHEEQDAGRPWRTSPLYDRLAARGAVFGSKLGWERPNWFAPAGPMQRDAYAWGRQNWFDAVAGEHRAAREGVVVFDQTSFAKFELRGPGAEAALQWICANDVGRPPGAVIYTQMLNRRGGIEADLTVTRLAADAFLVVTGTGFATRDFDWIARAIPPACDARLVDVTKDWGVLALMGPRARDVLAATVPQDVSDAALPFARMAPVSLAGATVRALRITYVGELGYELHVPIAAMGAVYDALFAAGATHGLRDAGYRAIESLRLEKFYRAWGSDLSPDHTPLDAGLGWATKLNSAVPFQGREALAMQRASPPRKRLACFAADDPDAVLLGRETIWRDGRQAGWLSSGGYGHSVGANLGLGYVRSADAAVDDAYVLAGAYEIDVAGRRFPARVSLKPLYDPASRRVRG